MHEVLGWYAKKNSSGKGRFSGMRLVYRNIGKSVNKKGGQTEVRIDEQTNRQVEKSSEKYKYVYKKKGVEACYYKKNLL